MRPPRAVCKLSDPFSGWCENHAPQLAPRIIVAYSGGESAQKVSLITGFLKADVFAVVELGVPTHPWQAGRRAGEQGHSHTQIGR
jgi:hypothetical protein